MDYDDILWDLDDISTAENDVEEHLDSITDDTPLPEGIDERKIEQVLAQVKAQFVQLQRENSKMLQLVDMVKKRIEACVMKEGPVPSEVEPSADPFNCPLDLEVKKEVCYRSEIEEDDEEEDEMILGGD